MYGLLGSGDIWLRYNYMKIWNLKVQKNLDVEKIIFKIVQMKFLAMHITNQKLRFDIFRVGNVQNIFMEHDLNDFWNKIKSIILTHTVYFWLYKYTQQLKTGFVLQGHSASKCFLQILCFSLK